MIKKLVKKIKNNRKLLFLSVVAILVVAIGIFSFTLSAEVEDLDDEAWVAPQSELLYFLNVTYDGVDRDKKESNDNQLSLVYSGIIYVEDKLPEGLTFNGFVIGEDGTVGNAVMRSDGKSYCRGSIVDDSTDGDNGEYQEGKPYNYHGLHYDEETRTVSFKVTSLQAGCQLNVGIKTITPDIQPGERKDFYNFAITREDSLTVESNTVHAYMQEDEDDEIVLYNVIYKYDTATKPDNAPALSESNPNQSDPVKYTENTVVGIRADVQVEGYEFLGWELESPSGLQIDRDSKTFVMPSNNVVFVGKFREIQQHTVTYQLKANTPTPPNYEVPGSKKYYPNAVVKLDSLKEGEIVNGYRFSGWYPKDPSNLEINDDTYKDESGSDVTDGKSFIMPEDKDVLLEGYFEAIKYTVTYQFMGDTLPPNPNNYLPPSEEHAAGETVTLATVTEPAGYTFLGWYYDVDDNKQFTMPAENITIYGEWRKLKGKFAPEITKEITSTQNYYRIGDIVEYKITVRNTAAYEIREVIVAENNENAYFIEGTGYELVSAHYVSIASIGAGASVQINARYNVTADDIGTITNEVEILGALADDGDLDTDQDYTDTAEFTTQSKIKVCKVVDNLETDKSFKFKISSNNGFETYIRIQDDECQTIYVDPGTYKIEEIVPQEYEVTKVEGAISSDGASVTVTADKSYEITYTNTYTRKAFYHSSGDAVNKITQSATSHSIAQVKIEWVGTQEELRFGKVLNKSNSSKRLI